MITLFKIYETWNNNIIDKSLFISGRAKYNPKVKGKSINYETDNKDYIATIKQLSSGRFLCKIYKIKNGKKVRIRKKLKKSLQTAHNFIREFLNDRVDGKKLRKQHKSKEKTKKKKTKDPLDKLFVDFDDNDPSFDFNNNINNKTIIRRFT